ncbi:OX-2 membrane glycoprotein-like isoform X1 [Lagopus leucura]|uniref:OX-2 membrane glycoprotein-like isoform X1 n=1 Tax=Lagopus leucura TaxID=30410 RepID=UPI001C67AFBF|nr:OX-2 membrane glycoprotein-like isoform X1 [Lagopus leucura]
MHKKVQSVQAGGNITFSCQSVMNEDVIQVTWQKEMDGAEDNIATYSTMNGQKIAKDYEGHVSFAHSSLQASAISLHRVTLQDEGCYKCIFNTFPSGAVTGRMCLKVYAISDPKVEAKLIPSPDKDEVSEVVVGMSCSATGKPAPKITWQLPSTLLQKPKEYHIKLSNQTITVISNFTHSHSKILKEYPVACVVQHPSLNVTLSLPMDNLTQGQDSINAPTVAIAVGVLVPLMFLLLFMLLLCYCLRHLRDPERNTAWPCWVGLCSLAEEEQNSEGNHTLIPLFCLARPCFQGCVLNRRGALEEEHAAVPCSGREMQPHVSLLGSVKDANLTQDQTQLDAAT